MSGLGEIGMDIARHSFGKSSAKSSAKSSPRFSFLSKKPAAPQNNLKCQELKPPLKKGAPISDTDIENVYDDRFKELCRHFQREQVLWMICIESSGGQTTLADVLQNYKNGINCNVLQTLTIKDQVYTPRQISAKLKRRNSPWLIAYSDSKASSFTVKLFLKNEATPHSTSTEVKANDS